MVRDDGRGGGGSIRYPSILGTLGADYEQRWVESTHTEIKRIRTSVAQARHFGDIPAAQDFAAVYAAAQHVYEATLRGIQADLQAAGTALAQAGREIRDRDEASAGAFQHLMARWSADEGLTSTQEHDRAFREAQVRLDEAAVPPAGGEPSDSADGSMDTGGSTPNG